MRFIYIAKCFSCVTDPFNLRALLFSLLALAASLSPLPATASGQVELAATEKNWLSAHPGIRLGSDAAWPPLDYRDPAGIQSGMCADYFNLVAGKLGIQVTPGPDVDWSRTMAMIRSGDLDAITCLAKNASRSEYIAFTDIVTDIPLVIITNDDYPYISGLRDMQKARVAMVDGYSTTDLLTGNYPDLLPVVVSTPLEALTAVATGQADAYVGVLAVTVHLIQNRKLANLRVAAPAELPPLELRFGFRKDWQAMADIFSKAIAAISPEEHTAIAQHWVSVRYDPVVDYSLLWKVGGTLGILLVLAILWISQVQRQKRLLQLQKNTLQALTNDLEAYGNRVSKELDMARQTQSVLLPDTERLKEILDVHDIHIDSRFEPSSELGGDFWGLCSLDEDRAAILAVDFSGHGINAALNTFRLHALLDSEKQNSDNPALYLEQLNRRLSPLLPPGQYATMFYGIIDRARDLLTYAGAATPTPLVFLPGSSGPLTGSGQGFPLGMFDESAYDNRELPFPVGASLLLYSDAATEGKTRAGTRLEEEGLVKIIVDCLEGRDRKGLVRNLKNALDSELEQPLADDLTIICATRLA